MNNNFYKQFKDGIILKHKIWKYRPLNEKILSDAIFHSAPGMIFLYDEKNELVRWNKKHEDITGYSAEELFKINVLDWFIGDEISRNIVKDAISRAVEEGFGDGEVELQKKDGTTIPMYFTASGLYLDGKQYFAGVAIDITERKKKESEIFYLSYHDQLTGLYNRRFYEEELNRLDTKRNLPLTIVMGDVNGLKLINDSFGHVMGDELIKKVAQLITRACRDDDIIARMGGDEFVIILPKTDALETEKILNRIAYLSLSEKVGATDVSIAFGFETKVNEEEKIENIFKKAEDKMYKKKLFESPGMRGRTIKAIINNLYQKNKREEEHSYRVSELCKKMGKALRLTEYEVEELKTVGLLHDIGKIAIDENILNKQGKLTENERKEINRHPEIGYRILGTVNDMSQMAEYVLAHHERWDGKGYPKGLKGEDIPMVSRIITIADAYDEMTSDKSYGSALTKELAILELQEMAGSNFDPKLVGIFIEKVIPQQEKLKQKRDK
nr:HD domain-containing phosphohydrolase [Clostridium akagii]